LAHILGAEALIHLPMALPGLEPVVLREVPLAVDPGEVRAFQGYKPPLDLPDLAPRLEAARQEVAAVIEPRLAYRILPVARAEPDRLTLGDGTRLAIPDIGRHWGPVASVAAALVTVGGGPDAAIAARRAAGDAIGVMLLDSAASAAAECLAEWVNDHLCQLGVSAGLRVTNRISPGLAGWAVADRVTLVRLLPAADLGVALEPDGTMRPAKSISLLVGIGREARVDHYFVQCRRCWAEACPARRMPAVAAVSRVPKPPRS
jgi:hypothetical protein